MKEKEFKIKFIPTGNVFTLPEADIDEILKNDRGNYQVLDKNYKYKKTMTKIPELTVLDQVLDGDTNNDSGDEQPDKRLQELKNTKKENLVKYCEDNKIEIAKNANKEEIINAILEFETEE